MQLPKLSSYILLLTLFLVPLVGHHPQFGYEKLKVIIFLGLTLVAGLIWWLEVFRSKGSLRLSTTFKLGLFWIISLGLASAFGVDFSASLIGREPYNQGLLVYLFLFLFGLMVSKSRISFDRWLLIILGSSLLVSTVAIIDWIKYNWLYLYVPNYAERVVSTFGQPNFYSGFLLLTTVFNFWLFIRSRWQLRLVALGLLTLQTAGIIVSDSKSAMAILPLGLGLVILSFGKPMTKLLIVLLMLNTLMFSFNLWSGYLTEVIDKEVRVVQTQRWLIDNAPEKRIYIWEILYQSFERRPIFGYGLENIGTSYKLFFDSVNFNTVQNLHYYSLRDLMIDRSHNYFLDLLIFSGLVGLCCYLVFIIWLIFNSKQKPALVISLIVYLIWISFQNQSIVHLMYFWWLVGVMDQTAIDT